VELRPDWAEAWSALAMALALAKKHAEALEAANRCVALAPMRPEAHLNLGFVHERAGRIDQAEAAYRRAMQIDPNFAVAYRNLAAVRDARGDVAGAIPLLERALALAPNDVEGWNNLSSLRRRMNDAAGALEAADRALRLAPGHPPAHGNRGLALLTLGDYERGFAEYEWRWRCDNFTTAARDFGRPLWDGSDPSGRTILVHTEQGYGDTIQFARYVPMLADRGAKVILECSVPLRTLMGSLRGVSRVVPTGVRPACAASEFAAHFPHDTADGAKRRTVSGRRSGAAAGVAEPACRGRTGASRRAGLVGQRQA
jgi:cytochrome c-type biogenesis protein CcmH/NrfG